MSSAKTTNAVIIGATLVRAALVGILILRPIGKRRPLPKGRYLITLRMFDRRT